MNFLSTLKLYNIMAHIQIASEKITKKRIDGMLIVLNKLYWKLPVEHARFIIAEASDLPGLNGHFEIIGDMEIIFVNE